MYISLKWKYLGTHLNLNYFSSKKAVEEIRSGYGRRRLADEEVM